MPESPYPSGINPEWRSAVYPVLTAIRDERINQFLKWGFQAHDLPTWLTILSEEVGELSQEVLAKKFFGASNREKLRAEAVQVAAVAAAIVQYIDEGRA